MNERKICVIKYKELRSTCEKEICKEYVPLRREGVWDGRK
jgi:hypothetical protein